MVYFNVVRKGIPFERYIKNIEQAKELNEQEMKKVGQDTHKKMIEIISKNKKRPGSKGRFEKAITLDIFKDGWGIGNIDKLDTEIGKNAWAAINWGTGSNHPMSGKKVPVGKFNPGEAKPNPEAFQAGTWNVGNGNYTFIVIKFL